MKFKVILIFLIMIAVLNTAAVAETHITVYVDGEHLVLSVEPALVEDTTMVPMRSIFEALGARLDWNEDTRTITALRNQTTISYTIGYNSATRNGVTIPLPVAGFIKDGITMVPLRFVSESLGAQVKWNGDLRRIDIITVKAESTTVTITAEDYNASLNRFNYQQGGTVFVQGEWVYFKNEKDNKKIYKMKNDGSSKTKVADYAPTRMMVSGDWIYFTHFREPISRENMFSIKADLYKVKTDGTGLQLLLEQKQFGRMSVSGEWIYYSILSDGPMVYKVRMDGTENQVAFQKMWNFDILGSKIYFHEETYGVNLDFYEMSLDGRDRRKLMTRFLPFYQLLPNNLIYTTEEGVWERPLDNPDTPVKLSNSGCRQAVLVSDTTMLCQLNKDDKLYRMNKDGTNKTLLIDENSTSFQVAGNLVYLMAGKKSGKDWVNWATGEALPDMK